MTSGTTRLLVGYAVPRDKRDLHDFAVRVLGALEGVTASGTALLLRTYERAGPPAEEA
ncbi:hypothetical protein [Streptomyces sp. NPDC056069]|uniref:hypothetical protein n=1 Tax=unclassified Streptomyces TaxID=2593676 RepID=UPI0035D9942F